MLLCPTFAVAQTVQRSDLVGGWKAEVEHADSRGNSLDPDVWLVLWPDGLWWYGGALMGDGHGGARWRLVGDTLWLGNDYQPYFHTMIDRRIVALQHKGYGLAVMDSAIITNRPPYPVPDSIYWSKTFRDTTSTCAAGRPGQGGCGTWVYQVSKKGKQLILVRLDSLSRATAGVAIKAILTRDSLERCHWMSGCKPEKDWHPDVPGFEVILKGATQGRRKHENQQGLPSATQSAGPSLDDLAYDHIIAVSGVAAQEVPAQGRQVNGGRTTAPLGAEAGQPRRETLVADLAMDYPNDSAYVSVWTKVGTRDSLLFLVDLGAGSGILWPKTRAFAGAAVHATGMSTVTGWSGTEQVERAVVDSLRVGDIVVTHYPVLILDVPGAARHSAAALRRTAGILGRDVFRGYDLEFNFPARRLRVYRPSARARWSAWEHNSWAGVRGMRCTANTVRAADGTMADLIVVDVMANGHLLHGFVDTGAPATVVTLAAANDVLGITPTSPGVTVVDTSRSPVGIGKAAVRRYQATGLTLTVAEASLRRVPVVLAQVHMLHAMGLVDRDQPDMILGLNAVNDRIVFVSSSTNEVCLGPR
jgi:hypothetical protein